MVTGAAGFAGSALANALEDRGHRIVRISLALGNDVSDPQCFEGYLHDDMDIVFHLAAKTYVPESWDRPGDFYRTNGLGALNVLEYCRKADARMVYVSAYVYGLPQYLPIDEKHPVRPNNPYAHSKWLGEQICSFYGQHLGVKAIILRPSNLYGPGQADCWVIPGLVSQIKADKKIMVKDGTPRRDFLHIRDFLSACITVLEHEELAGVYNVSSGSSISIAALVKLIIQVSGIQATWEDLGQVRPNEIEDSAMSSRLIEAGIWKPCVSLREGLQELLA